jgi:uncharacterized membrane protein HdeD (DUF308 family)
MLTTLKTLIARHLPWWLVMALGVACVAVGGILTARPFASLSALAALTAAALLVSGVSDLASAASASRPWLSRVTGLLWIVAGVLAASWPGLTIGGLAIAVGIALVLGGAVKVASAMLGAGDERFLLGVSGLTSAVVGVLALSWPGATVLVLAVLFGVRTVMFGFGQIATGFRLRGAPAGEPWSPAWRWPRTLRLAGAAAGLLLALGGMAVSVAIDRAQPGRPGPFYSPPSPMPAGPPGTLIRSELIDGFHRGATTYRVLYTSTGFDGRPTAVSGLVLVPDGPPPAGGRRVIAYTHGTVGVASNCAPSLAPASQQPLFLEGGDALLAAGYVIAAPDYQGLGTPGPHPYLIGASEAMNALDGVRAARNLPAAHASADIVVWGHSQGGHASVFTGQIASSYAPELHLWGVAAGAPVPNLIDLFKVNIKTNIGKILIAMALASWQQVYHDAELSRVVKPAARPAVAKIARHCLYGRNQVLGSVPSALVLGLTFLSAPVWETEPWHTIAEQNTPGAVPVDAPMLIVQGAADTIVDPAITKRYVDRLCASGVDVDLRLYPGIGHLETGHDAAPDVERWIADRFAGKPAPSACG